MRAAGPGGAGRTATMCRKSGPPSSADEPADAVQFRSSRLRSYGMIRLLTSLSRAALAAWTLAHVSACTGGGVVVEGTDSALRPCNDGAFYTPTGPAVASAAECPTFPESWQHDRRPHPIHPPRPPVPSPCPSARAPLHPGASVIRSLSALLLTTLLAGCQSANDICATFLGEFSGTFDGDASGELTLTVTEGDGGAAIVSLTLEGEVFSAVGNGEVQCEDGELVVTLIDNDGNEIGEFTGSMIDEAGEWSLGTGESGTWSFGQ